MRTQWRWLVGVVAVFIGATSSTAHVPHDRVTWLQLIDDGEGGRRAFALVRSRLYRSADGLVFERAHRGVTCNGYQPAAGAAPGGAGAHVVVACDRQLYRSDDGGLTFQAQATSEIYPRQIRLSPGFASDRSLILTGPGNRVALSRDGGASLTTLRVRAGATALAWAGARPLIGSKIGALATMDERERLLPLGQLPNAQTITALAHGSVDEEEVVFAGTASGRVYRLSVQSGEIAPLAALDGPVAALSFVVDARGPLLGAVTDERGVFLSRDTGASFVHHGRGILRSSQSTDYEQASFYDLSLSAAGEVWVGTFTGLYRAEVAALEDPERPLVDKRFVRSPLSHGHVVGLGLVEATGDGPLAWLSLYGGGLHRLSLAPGATGRPIMGHPDLPTTRLGTSAAQGSVVLASSYSRVILSSDAGEHWRTQPMRPPPGTMRALKRRVWKGAERQMPGLHRALRRVLLDTGGGELDGTPLAAAISPTVDRDQTLFVGVAPYGLLRSQDLGETFAMVWDGEGTSPRSIAASPRFADDGVVWIASSAGVFRSDRRGRRPTPCWDEAPPERPLLAFADDGAAGLVFLGAGDGLYVSADACGRWQKLDVGSDNAPIAGLAVSPAFVHDHTFFVQASGLTLRRCTLEVSSDAVACVDLGRSFLLSPVAHRDGNVLLALSPAFAADGIVVAVDDATVHVSHDRGTTFVPTVLDRRYEVELLKVDWFNSPLWTEGPWVLGRDHPAWPMGTVLIADHPGAQLAGDFVGTALRVLGERGPDGGRANVWLDGALVERIDTYASHEESGATLWAWQGREVARHRLVIEVLGESERRATGSRVTIDAIDVVR